MSLPWFIAIHQISCVDDWGSNNKKKWIQKKKKKTFGRPLATPWRAIMVAGLHPSIGQGRQSWRAAEAAGHRPVSGHATRIGSSFIVCYHAVLAGPARVWRAADTATTAPAAAAFQLPPLLFFFFILLLLSFELPYFFHFFAEHRHQIDSDK